MLRKLLSYYASENVENLEQTNNSYYLEDTITFSDVVFFVHVLSCHRSSSVTLGIAAEIIIPGNYTLQNTLFQPVAVLGLVLT